MLLNKFLKTPVFEYPSTVPNTAQICTTATLSYLLITVKKIHLEKVSLSDMENLTTLF